MVDTDTKLPKSYGMEHDTSMINGKTMVHVLKSLQIIKITILVVVILYNKVINCIYIVIHYYTLILRAYYSQDCCDLWLFCYTFMINVINCLLATWVGQT